MSLIRVGIVENYTLYKEGIIKILENEADIEIVGGASDGIGALKLAQDKKPDVLILDSKQNINHLQIIRLIRKKGLRTWVLLLMDDYDEDMAISAIQSGASGILLKNTSSIELLKAIRSVSAGEIWVKRHMVGNLINKFKTKYPVFSDDDRYDIYKRLTKKQIQIMKLVVMGHSNKEIARKLFISEYTVKSHLYNIFKKLKVNKRGQLSSYAPLLAINQLIETNI